MRKWIIGFLARNISAWNTTANKSLQAQLMAARAEAQRMQDRYLEVVDERAVIRTAYQKLAYARLKVNGLDRAGGGEHPVKDKGLSGHRRRSAPTAGDR